MASFIVAMRDRFKIDPRLAGLSQVYSSYIPSDGVIFPYLVIDNLYSQVVRNTTNTYYLQKEYQFVVFSLDQEECNTLGYAAYDVFFPRPTDLPFEFDEGIDLGRDPGQAREARVENRGIPEDQPVWRFDFRYTFVVG